MRDLDDILADIPDCPALGELRHYFETAEATIQVQEDNMIILSNMLMHFRVRLRQLLEEWSNGSIHYDLTQLLADLDEDQQHSPSRTLTHSSSRPLGRPSAQGHQSS